MIKQIQLRGISRTPSDRMTADGGCAESLNVYVQENEITPAVEPKDITADFVESGHIPGRILMVHKSKQYENIIYHGFASNAVMAMPKGSDDPSDALTLFALQSGETIQDITSIGNTVIVSTDKRMEYVLYKEGAYHELGDHIPVPQVEFRCKRNTEFSSTSNTRSNKTFAAFEKMYGPSIFNLELDKFAKYDSLKGWDQTEWKRVLEGIDSEYTGAVTNLIPSYTAIKTLFWDTVKSYSEKIKRFGHFVTPVMARYAVQLYNGSYIYQSVPILLGAGVKEYISALAIKYENYSTDPLASGDTQSNGIEITFNNIYDAKAFIEDYNCDGWEDVIKSVDIFLSTDVHYPLLNGDFYGLENPFIVEYNIEEPSHNNWYLKRSHGTLSLVPESSDLVNSETLDEILSKRNFYKIASFDISNLQALKEGYNLMTDQIVSQDNLVVNDELPDGYLPHRIIASSLMTYNNKLMLSDITYHLTPGYGYLNGTLLDSETHNYEYEFKYHILNPSNETAIVMARAASDKYIFSPYDANTKYAKAFAWISYPDKRCYKVDVRVLKDGVETSLVSYGMEAHPHLNCSYAFFGLDKRIGETEGDSLPSWDREENPFRTEDNTLWASVINTPFLFEASGKLTFSAKVLAAVATTRALSEGQFGQFPLYVFTEDGIWTIEISSDGSFSTVHALSRDVAVKSGVIPLDQEAVFVSDRGVMLLAGSSVQCLSDKMNGKHYQIESSVADTLAGSDWSSYVTAASDSATFMEFVKASDIVYDYVGTRLLFFNPSKSYGYVYHFATTSWHKFTLPAGMTYTNPVNTYPEATASMTDGKQYLYIICSEEALLDHAAGQIQAQATAFAVEEIRKALGGGYGINVTSRSSAVAGLKTQISAKGSATYVDKPVAYIFFDGSGQEQRQLATDINTATSIPRGDAIKAIRLHYPLDTTSLTSEQLASLNSIVTAAGGSVRLSMLLYVVDFVPSARETAKTALTTAGFTSAQAEAALLGESGLDLTGMTAEAVTSLRSSLTDLGISSEINAEYQLYNYSTVIDTLSEDNLYGIIVTRPFDLGEPDVRKAIKSIRVRGAFDRNDVKYLLLGSFDGIEWKLLPSLRGGSYKMFRLVLLAKLGQTERISWIDVDYEPRYATKLR